MVIRLVILRRYDSIRMKNVVIKNWVRTFISVSYNSFDLMINIRNFVKTVQCKMVPSSALNTITKNIFKKFTIK